MSETKCYEWIEYDGTNPPTDTAKELECMWEDIKKPVFSAAGWGSARAGHWAGLIRYRYLEPYAPPLPKCAVCGSEPSEWESGGWHRCGCRSHGIAVSINSRDEARVNWRKMWGARMSDEKYRWWCERCERTVAHTKVAMVGGMTEHVGCGGWIFRMPTSALVECDEEPLVPVPTIGMISRKEDNVNDEQLREAVSCVQGALIGTGFTSHSDVLKAWCTVRAAAERPHTLTREMVAAALREPWAGIAMNASGKWYGYKSKPDCAKGTWREADGNTFTIFLPFDIDYDGDPADSWTPRPEPESKELRCPECGEEAGIVYDELSSTIPEAKRCCRWECPSCGMRGPTVDSKAEARENAEKWQAGPS